MLQVARLAPRLLGDSAALVAQFLRGEQHQDGGFRDRAGQPDLYYTVFGMEGLMALQEEVPVAAVHAYLRGFRDGEGLDLVHLSCLARCWANLPEERRVEAPRAALAERLEAHRTADGGYHNHPEETEGNLYGCFVGWGGYQDLGLPMPDPEGMLGCIEGLRAEDGGFANQTDLPMGLVPSTTAAVTLLRQLGREPEPELAEWLLSRHYQSGGFFATPLAPIPDLLSTATALHALTAMKVSLEPVKEACLNFLDSLWTNRGAFHGSWQDEALDCEYTYYALLALGHLSL